ncbi:MAG: 1-deoxy-D-xylulose-5-phosphate synthase [Bacteroidia bacterium]|nr:1-deoxy-D-xylulose-5-phosphate synthase [Bacteroidia bacterium]
MQFVKNRAHILSELEALRLQSPNDLEKLCKEYRDFIIDQVLQHGGHFSANLGTIELTVALHYVLNTPYDQLVWDVGHQAYLHKVLTGRKDVFHTIRKKGGLSGFPKQSESPFDVFGTGHSSTSISAILGLAEADKLLKQERQHVAVIGDGSLTGGMAWEAINNAAVSNTNVLIVVNDNQMGIDPNAGALNNYLNNPDVTSNFFTDLGFHYRFAKDGHNVQKLVQQLQELTKLDGPKVWHVKTVKGKGYKEAERQQTKWHAVKYVKIPQQEVQRKGKKFQDVFGLTLLELARSNDKIVGITPAMPTGCSMKIMMDEFPDRCFDVGIAEQHAVTFSAGLATNGLIPVCNIYSTFLQRGYDQVIHDVCLQNLHVVFCLDRSGVVGEDGATHHGLYDMAFLRCIPNLTLMVPSNEVELRNMMYTAVNMDTPVAIRYPKIVGTLEDWQRPFEQVAIGKVRGRYETGTEGVLLSIGTMLETALEVQLRLATKGLSLSVIDMGFVKPLDCETLDEVFSTYENVYTLEDGCIQGGFGSAILEYAATAVFSGKLHCFGFPDAIIEHATRQELFDMYGLSTESISEKIEASLP